MRGSSPHMTKREDRPGMTAYRLFRRLDQPLGGLARFVGDFRTREHAGDLLAPPVGRDLRHAGRDALAARKRILADDVVLVGARRDLRGVRHADNLYLGGEAREPGADRVRDRTADPG